jgi:hypothetical protein
VPVATLTRPAQREEMAIVVYRPRPEAGKKTSTKQRFAFNRSDVTVILMIVYFALPGSRAGICAEAGRRSRWTSSTESSPMRQPRATTDRGARRHDTDCPRAAAALLGFVCSPRNSLDCRRRLQLSLRRHRVLSDFDAVAQGVGRSRPGCRFGLRPDLVGVCREHIWHGLHQVPDGDHRAALDDLLCARRIATPAARPSAAWA